MRLDDPKITAYALGELGGADRADVEAFLASSAEARAAVASIRETAATLTAALALEEGPGLGDRRLEELLDAGEQHPLRMQRDDVYHVITHPVPEPRRLRTGLLALAAALVIVVATVSILVSVLFRDRIHPGRMGSGHGGSLAAAGRGSTSADTDDLAAATSPSFAELLPEPANVRQDVPAITLTPVKGSSTAAPHAAPDGTSYALRVENPFQDVSRSPVSSFPFHSASNSYEAVTQALASNHLPARGSVRIEELVNAFDYGYAAPTDGKAFATYAEVASCPWEPKHRLVRIGLRAREESDAAAKIADDLRVSVEFNPHRVSAYRLIGFDRRLSTRPADGAPAAHQAVRSGQALTALYEVIPAVSANALATASLKYQDPPRPTKAALTPELLTLNLRYAIPAGQKGVKGDRVEQAIVVDDPKPYVDASTDFRFAAAVASYGLILTDSPHKGACSYDEVLALAQSARGLDLEGERAAFCDLVRHTRALQ